MPYDEVKAKGLQKHINLLYTFDTSATPKLGCSEAKQVVDKRATLQVAFKSPRLRERILNKASDYKDKPESNRTTGACNTM